MLTNGGWWKIVLLLFHSFKLNLIDCPHFLLENYELFYGISHLFFFFSWLAPGSCFYHCRALLTFSIVLLLYIIIAACCGGITLPSCRSWIFGTLWTADRYLFSYVFSVPRCSSSRDNVKGNFIHLCLLISKCRDSFIMPDHILNSRW